MELSNKKGNTLIYVVIALIAIAYVASTLIRMGHHNSMTQVNYSNSESARIAVINGFEKALDSLETTDKTWAEEFLQEWVDSVNSDNITNKWIVGDDSKYDSLGSEGKFRVRVLGFDRDSFNITLFSEGIGKGDSKASATGTYSLLGLRYKQETWLGNSPTNALQMDNGNFEFTPKIIVNGGTSVKEKMTIHSDATFNGDFRFDSLDAGGIDSMYMSAPVTVNGNAYYNEQVTTNGLLKVTGNLGIEGELTFGNNELEVGNGKKVYLNGGATIDGNTIANLNGCDLYAYDTTFKRGSNSGLTNVFQSGTFNSPDGNPISPKTTAVDKKVGVGSKPAPPIFFNPNVIDPNKIYKLYDAPVWSAGQVGGTEMNSWYEDADTTDMLWNDFLIIKFKGSNAGYYPFKDDGVAFKYKTILIVEDINPKFARFYESDMGTANTVMYLDNYKSTEALLRNVTNFRGFIYCNKTSQQYLSFTAIHDYIHIKGSIYFSDKSFSKFEGNGGDLLEITFDQAVIDELAPLGVFTDPNDTTSSSGVKKLEITETNISTRLLSRSF